MFYIITYYVNLSNQNPLVKTYQGVFSLSNQSLKQVREHNAQRKRQKKSPDPVLMEYHDLSIAVNQDSRDDEKRSNIQADLYRNQHRKDSQHDISDNEWVLFQHLDNFP